MIFDHDEMEDQKHEVAFDRKRHRRLSRNPDCRDPDHPGCEKCEEHEDG